MSGCNAFWSHLWQFCWQQQRNLRAGLSETRQTRAKKKPEIDILTTQRLQTNPITWHNLPDEAFEVVTYVRHTDQHPSSKLQRTGTVPIASTFSFSPHFWRAWVKAYLTLHLAALLPQNCVKPDVLCLFVGSRPEEPFSLSTTMRSFLRTHSSCTMLNWCWSNLSMASGVQQWREDYHDLDYQCLLTFRHAQAGDGQPGV